MFVLLSDLHDFIDAARSDALGELWMQDELTTRHLPLAQVVSSLICTAQSDERILLWRAEVESAGLRLPEKTQEIVDAVRARLETAKAILATTLNTELPRVQLRNGILLEPGLLAELPTFKCQQHIWSCSQPDGLSSRVVTRREVAHAP